jgi:hypothetical protein
MALKSRKVGNNIVFYNGGRHRLVGAIGPDVVEFFDDFTKTPLSGADALHGWTVTLVEAGAGGESTITHPDAAAGEIVLTSDNADNDGINMQMTGEVFGLLESTRQAYFGARVKTGEITESDFIVGLCITDTTLLGGLSDGVYFRKVDGAATVKCVTEKDSTETESAAVLTLVADTYYILEFYFDGTTVSFYVDGVLVASSTTNIPDDELLTPSIHFLTGNAAVETMTVDWVRAIQIGR